MSPKVLQEIEAAVHVTDDDDLDGDENTTETIVDAAKISEWSKTTVKNGVETVTYYRAIIHNDVTWEFGGALQNSKGNSADGNTRLNKVSNTGTLMAYWSNSHMKNGFSGRAAWYEFGKIAKITSSRDKGQAYSVRCMVDKENR